MDHIIRVVEAYGEPYTEKSSSYRPISQYSDEATRLSTERTIYKRDIEWLKKSRAVIAEVSGASTGTGREIEKAVRMKKPVFCLYHKSSLPSLMITQDPS